jgi:hypothetical protein
MQFIDLKVSSRYLHRSQQPPPCITDSIVGTKQITIAFYRPGPDDRSWMNKLVAACCKNPFSHCEMIFENGFATSILHGETVFCKQRTFASDRYVFKGFSVSRLVHDRMYQYACLQSTLQVPFSSAAMLTPVIRWKLGAGNPGTFCSKYIVEVLQQGNITWAMRLDPDYSSPSSLYDDLAQERNVCFNTVPHKLNQLKIVY